MPTSLTRTLRSLTNRTRRRSRIVSALQRTSGIPGPNQAMRTTRSHPIPCWNLLGDVEVHAVDEGREAISVVVARMMPSWVRKVRSLLLCRELMAIRVVSKGRGDGIWRSSTRYSMRRRQKGGIVPINYEAGRAPFPTSGRNRSSFGRCANQVIAGVVGVKSVAGQLPFECTLSSSMGVK